MYSQTQPALTLTVARGLSKADLVQLLTREAGRRRSFVQELGALVRKPAAQARLDFRVA